MRTMNLHPKTLYHRPPGICKPQNEDEHPMKLAAISTAMDDTGAVVSHRRHIRYTDLDAHEEAKDHGI